MLNIQVTGLLYSSLADPKDLQPDIQIFLAGFYAECSQDGVIGATRYNNEHVNIR